MRFSGKMKSTKYIFSGKMKSTKYPLLNGCGSGGTSTCANEACTRIYMYMYIIITTIINNNNNNNNNNNIISIYCYLLNYEVLVQ
jgi:hypothetical protein